MRGVDDDGGMAEQWSSNEPDPFPGRHGFGLVHTAPRSVVQQQADPSLHFYGPGSILWGFISMARDWRRRLLSFSFVCERMEAAVGAIVSRHPRLRLRMQA
jgi:hypothetical protein